MPKVSKRRKKLRFQPVKKDCPFCKGKGNLRWQEYEAMKIYLSPRSRILSRMRTGICAKHQRRLAEAIKHARHLGLLPFVTKVESH